MSTYRLAQLFHPRSVVVAGASPHDGSLGRAVLRNLAAAGFEGSIRLVNPHHGEIDGVAAVKSFADLPEAPDVVVITTPAASVGDVVAAAGQRGAAAAIIITAGLGHGSGSLAEWVQQTARSHGLRLLGPNCLGVMAPFARLNASFARTMPNSGDLALISQSGAIAAGLVEWASGRGIGFSA